jgi:hypothetical protein
MAESSSNKVELFDLFSNCETGYEPKVPQADLLMALHYVYHQPKHRLVSDPVYDELKRLELKKRPEGRFYKFLKRKPKHVIDYPSHIRHLSFYFQWKFMAKTGRWNENKIPYEMSQKRREKREKE